MAILPNEVFLAIFVSLMQGMFCTERPAPRFWNHPDRVHWAATRYNLLRVCRRFSALIMTTPIFWSHLCVHSRMPCSALIAVLARCPSTPLFLELRFIGRRDLIPTFASLLDVLSPALGRCVYFSAFTINSHVTDFLFGRLAGVAAASIRYLHLNVIPVDLSAQRGGHPIPVVFAGVLPSLTSYTLRNGFLDWKDPPFYSRIHHLRLALSLQIIAHFLRLHSLARLDICHAAHSLIIFFSRCEF
ncbi:hypothetical protein K438DRAFT_2014643 [Mycena galopus ATCC 62051]|nr:hypothetical protein K438DRAFT_2014643 [Mycena galopus ATCC 62051]